MSPGVSGGPEYEFDVSPGVYECEFGVRPGWMGGKAACEFGASPGVSERPECESPSSPRVSRRPKV